MRGRGRTAATLRADSSNPEGGKPARAITAGRPSGVRPRPDPRRPALEGTPFVLAQSAPDARVLPALECPLQARLHNGTAPAYLFGLVDLEQRGTRVPNREEQLRIFVTAGGVVTPVHEIHSFSSRSVPWPGSVASVQFALVNNFTSYAICEDPTSFRT